MSVSYKQAAAGTKGRSGQFHVQQKTHDIALVSETFNRLMAAPRQGDLRSAANELWRQLILTFADDYVALTRVEKHPDYKSKYYACVEHSEVDDMKANLLIVQHEQDRYRRSLGEFTAVEPFRDKANAMIEEHDAIMEVLGEDSERAMVLNIEWTLERKADFWIEIYWLRRMVAEVGDARGKKYGEIIQRFMEDSDRSSDASE